MEINLPKVYYSKDKWKEYPSYYVYTEDKNTIGYKQSAKGRVTGSIVTKCIKYDTLLAAKKIAGLYKEEFTEEQLVKINYGKDHEGDARNWYTSVTKNIVKNPCFVVPKFDYRLGAEHDGFVYDENGNELDGIIEIKCPMEIYKPLLNSLPLSTQVEEGPDYSHINESHYDQMQMEMEIFDKSWCDYIVYCKPMNFVHLERVYRNKEYWNILYEKIKIFIDAKLAPLLNEIGSNYPLNPK